MTCGTRGRRTLAAALLTLAVTGLGACGNSPAPPVAQKTTKVAFDQALHDKLPQAIKDRRTIRVAADASYAPMSFFAPGGRTIIGLEPDLASDMGTVLGVNFEFINTDFTKIIPQVVAGQTDIGISAMSDTHEREKKVDFVDYFSAGTSIIVQTGNPAAVTDIKSLCGKTVAVEGGTTQQDLLSRSQPGCGSQPMRFLPVPTYSDALVQLRTGRVAAVLADFPPARYLTTQPRTRSDYQLASTTQYEPSLFGIAISKQQPGIRDALQGALELLILNGRYVDVLQKWDVTDSAIKDTTVNSGH